MKGLRLMWIWVNIIAWVVGFPVCIVIRYIKPKWYYGWGDYVNIQVKIYKYGI